MATHALIAYIDKNHPAKVICINSHYDGGPENMLPKLNKYSSLSEVKNLFSGGRILELENTMEAPHNSTFYSNEMKEADIGSPTYFFKHKPFNREYTWDEVKPFVLTRDEFDTMNPKSIDDYESKYYYLFNEHTCAWSFSQLSGSLVETYKDTSLDYNKETERILSYRGYT